MPYCPKPPTSPASAGISMGVQAPIAPQRSESGDFYPHQIRTVWSKTGTLRIRFAVPKVLGFPPLQSAPFRHAPGPGWSGVATAMPSVAQYAAPLPGEVRGYCWMDSSHVGDSQAAIRPNAAMLSETRLKAPKSGIEAAPGFARTCALWRNVTTHGKAPPAAQPRPKTAWTNGPAP